MGKCSEGACSGRRLVGPDTIDATNRINPCDPRDLGDVAGQTSSEIVASHAIGATLLKAFNTVPMAWIADASPSKPKTVLFVSGDDANAKNALSEVLEEVGFAAGGFCADSQARILVRIADHITSDDCVQSQWPGSTVQAPKI